MKHFFVKILIYYVLIWGLFLLLNLLFFSNLHVGIDPIYIVNSLLFLVNTIFLYICYKTITNEFVKLHKDKESSLEKIFTTSIKNKENKLENDYITSVKNIYDEHLFSISHELRTPLAVISSIILTQTNNLKSLYKQITDTDPEITRKITNLKRNIEGIDNQVKHIETFIAGISDAGNNKDNNHVVNMHYYLLSVVFNCNSYSRNMKIFNNDVKFGDTFGKDFQNVFVLVNPHDLSRILMNIMTNAADAVSSAYKEKKLNNPNYEAKLKIRCLKATDTTSTLLLSDDYIRINNPENKSFPFYLVIEDNGPGIEKDHLNRIFDYKFSTKTEKGNYGLGLYLCLKLAEQNDLKIFIKTSPSGTSFLIGFPKMYLGKKRDTITCISDDSTQLFNESVSKITYKDDDSSKVLLVFKNETDLYGVVKNLD